MSWLFSRALVEEYSEAKSLGGEPSAPLNVMPTPHKFWHRDKTMEASNLSRFGLTFQVLTDDRGEELLTLFRAGFHAKTYQPQEKGQESTANDLDSGVSLRESLAKYDPATSSWRTPQCSLFEDSAECLETFARWGSMRNGELYRRRMPNSLVAVRQFIACATDYGFAQRVPTPTVSDAKKAGVVEITEYRQAQRRTTVCRLRAAVTELDQSGLHLNPTWIEWLMGFPIGWTKFADLETLRYPSVRLPLGKSSEAQ